MGKITIKREGKNIKQNNVKKNEGRQRTIDKDGKEEEEKMI